MKLLLAFIISLASLTSLAQSRTFFIEKVTIHEMINDEWVDTDTIIVKQSVVLFKDNIVEFNIENDYTLSLTVKTESPEKPIFHPETRITTYTYDALINSNGKKCTIMLFKHDDKLVYIGILYLNDGKNSGISFDINN